MHYLIDSSYSCDEIVTIVVILQVASAMLVNSIMIYVAVSVVKNPPANAGDTRDSGWIPESGSCPGGGNSSPPQSSCLENPMDRGAWSATVHGVVKSHTRLSTHIYIRCTKPTHLSFTTAL